MDMEEQEPSPSGRVVSPAYDTQQMHRQEARVDQGLFERLATVPGISGREDRIRDVAVEILQDLVDEISVDRLGNVIGLRRGDRPRVMLAAHMDSIGFLVKHIDDNGFIWISPVGGFDPRTLNAQRVLVSGKKDYVGLMSPKSRPIHVLTDEERKKAPVIEDIFVDVMAPADEVKENVPIGSQVTLYREPVFNEHGFSAPYLDDRLGVYVLLEALREARDTKAEIYAVVSVQEEVGLRGARTSAYGIDPDIGVALDITLATDTPGSDPTQIVTKLGKGVGITVMDGYSISDPRLVEHFQRIAESNEIEYQLEMLPKGGTDAGTIQMARAGVPVITISPPVRYVHTANEMASIKEVDESVRLMARFLDTAHEVDLKR
ncbi:MAG: M42 family metallopeptidase [Actinomycetota bacterium]|nr:M42 family metallopeptidase [Actinomycetota bacterium]